jgi:hypothetical protein
MDYNKLSLVELKNLCKSRRLPYGGSKKELIKRIIDFEKPVPVTINDHKGFDLPKGKKIVGVKYGDKEKRLAISKEKEKGLAKDLYYSMDVFYYIVDKDFNFV